MGGCFPPGLWKSPKSRVLLVWYYPEYICFFVLFWFGLSLYYTARYPPFVDLDHFYMLLYLPDSSGPQEELLHINF